MKYVILAMGRRAKRLIICGIAAIAIAGAARGDEADHDQIVREKGLELLRACNKGYPLTGAWEIDFCESYQYLQRRSVRQDGSPSDQAKDESDVIEYMITKEFFLDCITNVRPDPKDALVIPLPRTADEVRAAGRALRSGSKETDASRLKFCADYAETHAKSAAAKDQHR
jgi:hypothetical protein